jgi:hypothetical protein
METTTKMNYIGNDVFYFNMEENVLIFFKYHWDLVIIGFGVFIILFLMRRKYFRRKNEIKVSTAANSKNIKFDS